jgi:hypothetical protein
MIKLRPHHLLCTQGYIGKGYDRDFIANMTAVTNCLRNEADTPVEIIFSTDDICVACPHKIGENICAKQKEVSTIDDRMVDAFDLKEKEYIYQDLIKQINAGMNRQKRQYICGGCEWLDVCVY